jgi:hypothetical protein
MSAAARASILENYLRNLPADEPQRLKFGPMLNCLRRGEEPPADLEAALETK